MLCDIFQPYKPLILFQMRVRSTMTKAQLEEVEAIEESTVYSQAIHYANRIVYMRVPLDTNHFHRSNTHCDGESSSTITTRYMFIRVCIYVIF